MSDAERVDAMRSLLRIDAGEEEAVLGFCLEAAKEQILAYCHIDELPGELECTWIRIAADMYRAEGYGDAAEADVSSVQEGDQSVHFTKNRFNREAKTEDFTRSYTATLNKYRRVCW